MIHDENIQAMLQAPKADAGWDILIVSAGNAAQADFWQERLQNLAGVLFKKDAVVIAVEEDWLGGAGNGLGTLYAYVKASEKCRSLYGFDLLERQSQGASVALFHTAGKGKRLYPLAACEQGNKSAVKLPAFLTSSEPMTILDAVLRQTAIYAPYRGGRLSVFWGDQLFIPSVSVQYVPRHHIDILCREMPLPAKGAYKEQGLHHYGLVALGKSGEAQLVEKVLYETLHELMDAGSLDLSEGIGVSLGCYSLSTPITQALIKLFDFEITQRLGRMDSDPHFWMALTLDQETYEGLEGVKEGHYTRMQKFRNSFCRAHSNLGLFGAVDIGKEAYWWDFGSVAHYYRNVMKLTQETPEGVSMRLFFGAQRDNTGSCIVHSAIGGRNMKNCVVAGVKAEQLDVEGCVIINASIHTMKAKQGLYYNVDDQRELVYPEGAVRGDMRLSDEKYTLETTLDGDGKADWEIKLPHNDVSYAKVASWLSDE